MNCSFHLLNIHILIRVFFFSRFFIYLFFFVFSSFFSCFIGYMLCSEVVFTFAKYVANELFDDIFNRRRVPLASWKMQGTASHRGLRACNNIKGVFFDHLFFSFSFAIFARKNRPKNIEKSNWQFRLTFLVVSFTGRKAYLSNYLPGKNALEDTRESEKDNDQVIDSLLKK